MGRQPAALVATGRRRAARSSAEGGKAMVTSLTKRAVLHTLTGTAATGLLAACALSGAAPGTPAAPQAAAGPPVEIDFNTWYLQTTQPIVPLFPQFEQAHRVKINLDLNANNRDMSKYIAWYVSGTAPDVVNGDNFSWSQFYNSGNILELTEYLKRDKIDLTKQYSLMGSEIWCGKTYAMPWDADPRAVYFNRTMLKQVGAPDPWDDLKGQWTFDDMLKMAMLAARHTGDAATERWGVHMGHTGMSESNGMFVWSSGGTWADYDKMRYTLDSKESIDAHNLVYDWYTNKKVVIPNSVVNDLGGGEKPFGQGKVALRVRAAASQGDIKRESGDQFEWDIAPFPGRTKGTPGVTIVSGNPHTVSKTTKHPDECYEFVKWLAGPDVQGFWAKEKIQLPTLKQFQAEFVTDPRRHVHVFADAYKIPYGIHFRHNNTVRHYNEYGTEMEKVFAGQQGMTDSLTSFTQRVNQEVEYGACLPYKGMAVPIKP
jgi:ABC-type glycerol-3-phosphate transport system substrate-binding protein